MTQNNVRVFLETFGCQMNILDSELIEGQLKTAGYEFVATADKANVVLLNTCSVRGLSEQKVLSRLGMLKNRKDKGEKVVVGVLGCMAERSNDDLARAKPFIDIMIGPSKIHHTLEMVQSALKHDQSKHKTEKHLSYFVNRKGLIESALTSPLDDLEALDRMRLQQERREPWRAYVRITRGCNKFCTFCVVPRTRGPEMHRPPASIIDEIKQLCERGAKEITLLGQTINHYFHEVDGKHYSFANLLHAIHEQVPAVERLRFLTSYPRDFGDDALDVMMNSPRICNYLHIPAQSGSDKVLKEMNRGYNLATYMSLIERARSRMPDINFIGDMIVGFPNETEEDFLMSLELLRKVRFKNVFIFKYSPRPNTVAYKNFVDNVPDRVKKDRHNRMLTLQNEIVFEHHQAMVGHNYKILCESEAKLDRPDSELIELRSNRDEVMLTGRTTGDHIVHFRGSKNLIGTIVDVKITEARPLSLSGTCVAT